jgi:SAM-dependent methyltransferase
VRGVAPGKVLDIGCGRGLLLNKLRQRGWEAVGTELSEDAAAYARHYLKLPVFTARLEEIGFRSGEFDLIILWHVLEHMHCPLAALSEVSRLLKPGGMLVLSVPNFGSWEARWGRRHWFHLDVPRHLTHFTPRTLEGALRGVGLQVLRREWFAPEYSFFGFVQTVQNKLGLPHNLLYDLLRTRSAKLLDGSGRGSREVGRGQALLALATAVPLGLLSLLYVPAMALAGRGAILTVYAVKRHL